MRSNWNLVHGVLLAGLLAGCGGGGSMPTAPSNPNSGGGGGGGMGGGPAPTSVTVALGNIFFRSDRNGSVNAAVDTIAAGGKVTWTWVNTGSVPHSVQSIGSPSFSSSPLETGNGQSYELTFTTPGTYRYNCAVHGNLMTGMVVVQ